MNLLAARSASAAAAGHSGLRGFQPRTEQLQLGAQVVRPQADGLQPAVTYPNPELEAMRPRRPGFALELEGMRPGPKRLRPEREEIYRGTPACSAAGRPAPSAAWQSLRSQFELTQGARGAPKIMLWAGRQQQRGGRTWVRTPTELSVQRALFQIVDLDQADPGAGVFAVQDRGKLARRQQNK